MHLPEEFEFKFCSFVGIIHVFYPCPAMSVHLWANLMKFYLILLPHPPAVLEPDGVTRNSLKTLPFEPKETVSRVLQDWKVLASLQIHFRLWKEYDPSKVLVLKMSGHLAGHLP